MNKKLRALVLGIAFVCIGTNFNTINVSANEEIEREVPGSKINEDNCKKESEIQYRVKDDNTIEVVKYIGKNEKVDIPETIEDKKVTSIGAFAFDPYEGVEPNDLIPCGSMNEESYRLSSSVTSVTIPDTVTDIGKGAFRYCENLKSVKMPQSIKNIEDNTFEMCLSLEEINLSDSIQSIGEDAFCYCVKLKSEISLKNATTIKDGAFGECSNIEKVILSENLTDIGCYAFDNCKKLTTINMPKNLQSIKFAAFSGCENLSSVNFNDSLKSIEANAFFGCKSLKQINIPDSVSEIGMRAFSFCSGVKSIKLSNCLKEINIETFSNLPNISTVNIPKSVKSVKGNAFSQCPNLESITVDEGSEYLCSYNGALYNKDKTTLIKFAEKLSSIDIPETVTKITGDAFENCHNLQKIYIPDNVQDLDSGFFRDCPSLSEIKVSENNKNYISIDGVLYNKSQSDLIRVPEQMNQINLPASVTKLNEQCSFSDCDNLETISVDNKNLNYNSIDGVIFNKDNTDIIYIPKKIKVINLPETYNGNFRISESLLNKYSPINAGYALEAINVDKNNNKYTSIDGVLYNKNCDELIKYPGAATSVKLVDTVKKVNDEAFANCVNLKYIKIPTGVVKIGDEAFENCTSLESIRISNTTEQIGVWAFHNCDKLQSIYIPASVYMFGEYHGNCHTSSFEYNPELTVYSDKNATLEEDAKEFSITIKPASEYNYKEPEENIATETPKNPEDEKATETPKTPEDQKTTETPRDSEDVKKQDIPKNNIDEKTSQDALEAEIQKGSVDGKDTQDNKNGNTSDKANIFIIFTMIGSLIGALKLKRKQNN